MSPIEDKRPHRGRRLSGVLAVVGVVLLLFVALRSGGDVSVIAPAAATMPLPIEFAVATYNVQARPWLDDAQEKLPQISARLTGKDFFAIQECFQRFDLLAAQSGYPSHAYFGRLAAPWKLANSGLAAFTRLPVEGYVMEHFRQQGEFQNRIASKGILLTRLRLGGLPVDLYNTHMEAGDRPEAQRARAAQAQQMIEFVRRNSPLEHSVIVVGDFNMGPLRPAKTFAQYSPCHYSDQTDLEARTAAFEQMRGGLALRDAQDEVLGPVDDGIERFLFRAGVGHQLVPLSWHHEAEAYRRADGSALSDGAPSVVRFRLGPAQ